MNDGNFHPTDNEINNSNKLDSVDDKNEVDNDQNSAATKPQNSTTSTESPLNTLQDNLEQNINQIANYQNESKDLSNGDNINHDDINQTLDPQDNLNEKEQEGVKNESIENENQPTLNTSNSETEKTQSESTHIQSDITEPNTNQEGITNIESENTTIDDAIKNNEQNQNNTENPVTNEETNENNNDQDQQIENSPILDKLNEINETLSNIAPDNIEKNVNQPSMPNNNETTDTMTDNSIKSDEHNNKESPNSNEEDTHHDETSEQASEEKIMKENGDEKEKDNADEVLDEEKEEKADDIQQKESEKEQIDEVSQNEKVNKTTDEVQHEEKENINEDQKGKHDPEFPILEPEYPNSSRARNENPPDISQWEVNVNMGDSGNIFLNTESTTTEDGNYTIDQIAHLVIEDEDYTHVNNDNFDKVVMRIHKIHCEAHNNGDYELAQLSKSASQSLIQYFNEERLSTLNEAKVTEMTKLYEARKKDLQYLKEHWGNVIKNAKQMANNEMLQLQNEQDEELAAYDAKINNILSNLDENLPAQYKKYSSKVNGLRNVQKSMIKLNKYIEAKNIGQEIEILEQEEQKKNIESFKRKIESDRENLIKKQDEQFRAKYHSWERELDKIQRISKIEIEKAENRKNQIEKRVCKAEEIAEMTTRSSLQTQRGSNFSMNSKLPSMNGISSSCPKSARPNLAKKPTIINPAAQEFRQRAIINRITYSNIVVPKIKRPGQRQKPKHLR